MPDRDYPDFSFLNDDPPQKGSSIVTHPRGEDSAESPAPTPLAEKTQEPPTAPSSTDAGAKDVKPESAAIPPEVKPAKAETAAKKAAEASQPAWMDQAHSDASPNDSSTRFAAALGGGNQREALPWQQETPPAAAPKEAPAAEQPATTEPSSAEPPPVESEPDGAGEATSVNTADVATPSEPEVEEAVGNESDDDAVPVGEETLVDETIDWDEERQPTEADLSPTQNLEETLADFDQTLVQEAVASPAADAETSELDAAAALPASSETAAEPVPDDVPLESETGTLVPPIPNVSPVPEAAASLTAASAPPMSRSSKKNAPQTWKNPGSPKKLTFLLLVSYASAMTLVCLYLLIQSFAGKPHDLESLPDLRPPMKKEEIAYQLVPEAAGVAPGHTLRIGQSQRFGSLQVTPLRVTKETLNFSHYTGDPARKREGVSPVLKLWLKFENVSRDQKFAPLDRQLMLTRIVDAKNPAVLRSNQFLVPAAEKGNLDRTLLLFDLEQQGDWNFANIEDEPRIAPGESLEIYLPSQEVTADLLQNSLIWRVQFRKGYHPESLRGVTTLIEVQIEPGSIESV